MSDDYTAFARLLQDDGACLTLDGDYLPIPPSARAALLQAIPLLAQGRAVRIVPEVPAPLQATSNVIELQPHKRYLLVFKGEEIDDDAIQRALALLQDMGIDALGIAVDRGLDLEIVAMPEGDAR